MKRVLLMSCVAAQLVAQEPAAVPGTAARTGVVLDSYHFGSGFAFDHIVEWSVPVTLSHRFGPRFTLDLSSAYAHASAATTSGTLQVGGATDTDVRMSWGAVAGHLIVSLVGTWERTESGRIGLECYYTGVQRLDANPYRNESRPYIVFGALVERRVGRYRLFLNAENLANVRQAQWDPLLRPARGIDGRWTVDGWAPLDGRNVNGGVRVRF